MLKKITFFALCFGTSCCFSAPVNIDQEQDKLWDVMRSGSGDEVLKIMERLSPRYSEMNDEQKRKFLGDTDFFAARRGDGLEPSEQNRLEAVLNSISSGARRAQVVQPKVVVQNPQEQMLFFKIQQDLGHAKSSFARMGQKKEDEEKLKQYLEGARVLTSVAGRTNLLAKSSLPEAIKPKILEQMRLARTSLAWTVVDGGLKDDAAYVAFIEMIRVARGEGDQAEETLIWKALSEAEEESFEEAAALAQNRSWLSGKVITNLDQIEDFLEGRKKYSFFDSKLGAVFGYSKYKNSKQGQYLIGVISLTEFVQSRVDPSALWENFTADEVSEIDRLILIAKEKLSWTSAGKVDWDWDKPELYAALAKMFAVCLSRVDLMDQLREMESYETLLDKFPTAIRRALAKASWVSRWKAETYFKKMVKLYQKDLENTDVVTAAKNARGGIVSPVDFSSPALKLVVRDPAAKKKESEKESSEKSRLGQAAGVSFNLDNLLLRFAKVEEEKSEDKNQKKELMVRMLQSGMEDLGNISNYLKAQVGTNVFIMPSSIEILENLLNQAKSRIVWLSGFSAFRSDLKDPTLFVSIYKLFGHFYRIRPEFKSSLYSRMTKKTQKFIVTYMKKSKKKATKAGLSEEVGG